MQESFSFVSADLHFALDALGRFYRPQEPFVRRVPVWQLIRSLIGSQTYDAVAERALRGLMDRWPDPSGISRAAPGDVLEVIREVTHAEPKADYLVQAMKEIAREHPDHDLSFLRELPVREALDWLERLPGVGPKVSAATLNASVLRMPVFIVDSHVHRILLRFGFIGPRATAEQGRDMVTAAGLDADALLDLFVGMKKLGQTVCRPFDAKCPQCPLVARCRQRVELGRPPARAFEPFKSRAIAPRLHSIPGGPLMRG